MIVVFLCKVRIALNLNSVHFKSLTVPNVNFVYRHVAKGTRHSQIANAPMDMHTKCTKCKLLQPDKAKDFHGIKVQQT